MLMDLNTQAKQNVLILGSEGQIGSALVSHLRDLGLNVFEYDIARHSSQDLRVWPNDDLELLIQNSGYVFFLAFDVGGSHYLEKYQDSFDFSNNNLRIMSNTFSLLRKHATPFLFASSQMASMSYSNYGLLKQIGERMATSLGGRVVHFWNVYGYESDSTKYHAISDFISGAMQHKVIRMRTTGEESRDFLYVSDCCEALKVVMDHHSTFPPEMKLHITTGKFSRIIEVAEIVATELGAAIQPGTKTDLVQRDAKNIADLSFHEYWKPKTSLEEGILEIIGKMKNDRS
jgi:nucleoside-diphosphate-sugar epimerase